MQQLWLMQSKNGFGGLPRENPPKFIFLKSNFDWPTGPGVGYGYELSIRTNARYSVMIFQRKRRGTMNIPPPGVAGDSGYPTLERNWSCFWRNQTKTAAILPNKKLIKNIKQLPIWPVHTPQAPGVRKMPWAGKEGSRNIGNRLIRPRLIVKASESAVSPGGC